MAYQMMMMLREGKLWFKDLDKLRLNHFIWLVFEAMNLN